MTTPTVDGPSPTWTYEEPGSATASDVDVVRAYVQDTDPDRPLLTDLTIQWLIDQWMPRHDSLIYVAAVAAETISAKLTGIVNVSADGANVSLSDLADRYAALAVRLRSLHAQGADVGGEVDLSNLMFDTQLASGIRPLSFAIGMHDNAAAGMQDFGGVRLAELWDDGRV